jgi:4-hydroxybenzoate polyprenyltransferase
MQHVKDFLVVSRYEYMVGGVFFLFTVSALATGSWALFGASLALIAWGTAVWYLSHMVGSQINCVADNELDRTYKVRVAAAVDRLGSHFILGCIAVESVLALLVAWHMARLTGKPVLPVLWVIGWAVSMGYSLEPARFKRRGFLNPASLIAVLYTLPMIYGYVALRDDLDVVVAAALTAVGVQMFSLILINEVEDIPEDRAYGVETPVVRHGLRPVAILALFLFALPAVVVISGFAALIENTTARWAFVVAATLGQLVVIRDLVALARFAPEATSAEGVQGLLPLEVRRIGKRNSAHFAILGLTIAIGSALAMS